MAGAQSCKGKIVTSGTNSISAATAALREEIRTLKADFRRDLTSRLAQETLARTAVEKTLRDGLNGKITELQNDAKNRSIRAEPVFNPYLPPDGGE